MTPKQIELARNKITELTSFVQTNDSIQEFIEKLEENEYLTLKTSYQFEMSLSSKATYDLVGKELIELLKDKLYERNGILFKLEATDLIKED